MRLSALDRAVQWSYYVNMIRRTNFRNSVPYVINYLKYKTSRKQEIVNSKNFTPQIAGLHLIKLCNLSCDFCSASRLLHDGRDGNWKGTKADISKIKRIFGHPIFKNIFLVDLLGGEPLLVKELPEIVYYFSSTGRLTNMDTNGILLKRNIDNLISAGISSINISIYDENLKMLYRDLKHINKIFGVSASLVLFRTKIKHDQDEIINLARFVHDAGCSSLRFYIYRPMDFNPNINDVVYENDPDYSQLKSKLNSLFPGFVFWPILIDNTDMKQQTCAQLWQRIQVDMEGNLNLCCGSESKYANLFSSKTSDVYNHEILKDMRKNFLDKSSNPSDICMTCNLLAEPGW